MTKEDEPSVITQEQLSRLIQSMSESYHIDKIDRALKTAFGSRLDNSSMSFLERNAFHHGILEIVKNSSSKDEIGKNIADAFDMLIAEKISTFKRVLFDESEPSDGLKENKSLSTGLVRRRG